MGMTAAERQRRSRAHKSGNHALCDPARCGNAPAERVTEAVTARDARLGAPGRRLWDELGGDKATAGQRVLVLEACRIADRLETLDDFLRGREESWLKFHSRNEDGSIVEVVVDKALAEARQQAAVLKQILGELRQAQGRQQPQPKQEASRRDELAKRRGERRRAAGL